MRFSFVSLGSTDLKCNLFSLGANWKNGNKYWIFISGHSTLKLCKAESGGALKVKDSKFTFVIFPIFFCLALFFTLAGVELGLRVRFLNIHITFSYFGGCVRRPHFARRRFYFYNINASDNEVASGRWYPTRRFGDPLVSPGNFLLASH